MADPVQTLKDDQDRNSLHMEAANRFQAGLDHVVNVLLMLVLKFGRASTLLVVMGAINSACLVFLVICTVQIATLRSEMRDLLDRQEVLAKSQVRIEKAAQDTNEKVDQTNQKVEIAVEQQPKIEVDAKTGKAKIVVKKPPVKVVPPPSSASAPLEIDVKP